MNIKQQQHLISRQGSTTIIDQLTPYVTEQRQERINTVIKGRLNSIQLAIECPSDINNALAAVRSSEALGISTVHIIHPEGSAGSIQAITQGAFRWVDVMYYSALDDFLEHTRKENLQLAGGTVTATQPIHEVSISRPLCLILGNEQRGLSPEAKAACALEYTIPMYGMTESLNLSVSAAISLYDTTQRKRQHLGTPGDLTSQQQQNLRAHYFLNSVEDRLIRGLFS